MTDRLHALEQSIVIHVKRLQGQITTMEERQRFVERRLSDTGTKMSDLLEDWEGFIESMQEIVGVYILSKHARDERDKT